MLTIVHDVKKGDVVNTKQQTRTFKKPNCTELFCKQKNPHRFNVALFNQCDVTEQWLCSCIQ